MSRPYSLRNALHRDSALSVLIEKFGTAHFLAMTSVRPSSVTIANVTLSNANWTAIATGLSDVLYWRMDERNGDDFHYAFSAAPATYMTAFGWVSGTQDISAIYAKRKNARTYYMELEYWTI